RSSSWPYCLRHRPVITPARCGRISLALSADVSLGNVLTRVVGDPRARHDQGMSWPTWTGLGERRWQKSSDEEVQPPKTLWDLLQLLIVPAMLVVIAFAFNASQASREHRREDRQIREDRLLARAAREDATLNAYLSEMRDLILNHRL